MRHDLILVQSSSSYHITRSGAEKTPQGVTLWIDEQTKPRLSRCIKSAYCVSILVHSIVDLESEPLGPNNVYAEDKGHRPTKVMVNGKFFGNLLIATEHVTIFINID